LNNFQELALDTNWKHYWLRSRGWWIELSFFFHKN